MPTGFVAHGAPLLAVDPERGAPLADWAGQVRRPAAFLVVSAHFDSRHARRSGPRGPGT
jgi:aromatic ring-opening dioxygenase catalytic subunit (LigB family)